MESKLLKGVDTIIIRVSNIASKDWYVNKLGLTPIWDDPNTRLVVLDTSGPTSLTLWQTDQTVQVNRETASYPIFTTPDAITLRQELLQKGIAVEDIIQDEYVAYFFFFDPHSNLLEACQVLE